MRNIYGTCQESGVGFLPTVDYPLHSLVQTVAPFSNPPGPLRIVIQ
jgi:hypothetical protein